MLWRMTRGNIFFRHADVEDALKDPVTGNEVLKSVFIVFFQGDELRSRIKKVCAGFHAKLHNCPNTNSERQEMLKEINTRLEDLKNVMKQTDERKHGDLVAIAKAMFKWSIQIKKMKATYHVMNKFNVDVTNKCLIAECWVPKLYLKSVRSILEEEGKAVGSSIPSFLNIIPSDEDPPTFNKTNKFTRGFQNLIDAYGIATYREVNPAFFTIITFPFLFGVMFGDMGHGIILTIFAAWMTIWEKSLMKKKSKNEIWNIFFGGRYIILLMGLYSIYIGFIYNDFFSISLNIFQSYWSANYNESTLMTNPFLTLDPATVDYYQNPYPVGMDPIWQLAENKIIFLNTYKMKISIIIGVIHMIFGVIMSVANFWHFKKRVYIFTDFLPQVIFLILIFFYLVVMVILKWVMYDATSKDKTYGTRCAPPVLILFINMILFTPTESPYPFECHTGYIYENQELAQKVIMVLAILCIPVMLIAKPAYILCNRKKKAHDIEINYVDNLNLMSKF
ncbi:hypothetical protein AAG570_010403 [Ranatra chinensis]|uniref:V-type proton ATPase subunit a n=1 Tax=Ranatra chinensis TaxID=642074 RepID=A0ABD0Z4J5_9HEMI